MEISEKNPVQIAAYVNQVQQNAQAVETDAEKGRTNTDDDSVELSQNARDLQKAQQILRDLPEIRQDKVDALKQRIENGTYDIQADRIAAEMIKQGLINNMF